jgi:molecular chaperone GrpE
MPNLQSNSPFEDTHAAKFDEIDLPADMLAIEAAPIDIPQQAASVDVASAYLNLLQTNNALERKLTDTQRNAAESEHKLLLSMLDVADALDRLIDFAAQTGDPATRVGKTFVDGLESTRRIMQRRLEKAGVRRMSTLGTIPDTTFCAIDSERSDADATPGVVIEELIAGYSFNGKVLRTAIVVVAAEN